MQQLVQPVQVHADHLAPWLAFIGALVVATIAAVTAERRLGKQLAAEDKRHRDQLSFQRGETDRSELRAVLDALAGHLLALHDAVARLNGRAAWLMIEGDTDESRDDLSELTSRIAEASVKAGDQLERIRLRLGPEGDRLVERATAMLEGGRRARSVSRPITNERVEEIAAARTEVYERRNEFVAEALKFTRTQLHEEPSARPV